MQVKVQTVSELTINQLSDDQYKAEKAAGRINAGEVYACTPSPVKWEDIQGKPDVSGGGDVDYQELARRIPSWQWKVTMPQTVNQTVTATVSGQTYTSDFYAPQGSNVTFSVKADDGFIAGTLSPASATLTDDVAVTVTAATEKIIAAGNFSAVFKPSEGITSEAFTIPDGVNVVKITVQSNRKCVYAKVSQGMVLEFSTDKITVRRQKRDIYKAAPRDSDSYVYAYMIDVSRTESFLFEWSSEINKSVVDVDLTQAGQKRNIA
ncbi:MAG: hypothetical protein KIB45_05970 [Negativicoccus succinicivorans]|uniref:hypothetical protein n=1 Tax=Negativicoccus succinicivorans TaxID=620903 RepID=UPI0023549A64|nr:hypothetical protein [Negativicoccus succinicivorans]MBS5890610.1 hypothetical protein [Negativicoccus succinicivorans]